jgi:hypothetical protein
MLAVECTNRAASCTRVNRLGDIMGRPRQMPAIDESQLRHALSTMEATRPSLRRAELAGRRERLTSQRAIEQALKTSFAKAGVDIERLARLVADEQSEERRRAEKHMAEAVTHLPAAHEAFRLAVDNRRKSLAHLAGLVPLPASWFVNLDPFIIFEKRFRYIVDSHLEPMNSWVKCHVTAREGAKNSDDAEFDYWFLWENESDYAAVVNVTSSLVFTGHCSVSAAQGIISGDTTSLDIRAKLTLWEWWESPQIPISYEGSQNQQVLDLHVQGGHIFQSGRSKSKDLSFVKFDLSYNDMFFIPARETAVFTVTFDVSYSTDDYLNLENDVTADFASDPNFRVICPGVQLEVLTAPPVAGVLEESAPRRS